MTGPGDGVLVEGVRDLAVLTANLAAIRSAWDGADAVGTMTVGGDCGVELAPIERARRQHGDGLTVVWFDAHGDLNTPASSASGAFHGMVLRTLLGDGPAALSPTEPLSSGQVVLAGVRALDPPEARFVADRAIRHVSVAEMSTPAALLAAVTATGAEAVYVHIDLDVLDPATFSAVGVPEPDGLSPRELTDAVRALGTRFKIAGIGLTEHQPDDIRSPEDDKVLDLLAATMMDVMRDNDAQGGRQSAEGSGPRDA
ncbi:arginase family protein [Streptomyces avicenniae]|uniref:arginase family protein n=1 Tax=Streptomyces avicenniae TaxID=500153 RepID=UPI000DA5EDAD|nr:arginase family protein [Streptomyces avicenniae]